MGNKAKFIREALAIAQGCGFPFSIAPAGRNFSFPKQMHNTPGKADHGEHGNNPNGQRYGCSIFSPDGL